MIVLFDEELDSVVQNCKALDFSNVYNSNQIVLKQFLFISVYVIHCMLNHFVEG